MSDALLSPRHVAIRLTLLATYAIVFYIGICIVYPALAQHAGTSTLVIDITGLTSDVGQVRIAVFDSEELWLEEPVYAEVLDIEAGTCTWSIEDVLYGDYGIAVFHDENSNAENDSNFIGIPKEPYGFSNNARGRFGPPKWKDAKFEVSSPASEIEIELK